MRRLIFILLLAPLQLWSQSFSDNMAFFQYLINTRNYTDALLLLENTIPSNQDQQDSLNFYFGKTFYLDQKLYDASEYFDKAIESELSFLNEARFYNAFSKMHINEIDKSIAILNETTVNDSIHFHLKNFQLSGAYLLQRDFKQFDLLANNYTKKYYQLSTQESSFLDIRNDLKERKSKSPVLAGVMSAIIPGTGRIYAGKTGLGIGTLLTNAILGLQTWEAYRKDGVESARFIIFGSLFSVFYVGNIWGSVFTVKIANEEFQDAVNHKILVDLHIPLRTIFD